MTHDDALSFWYGRVNYEQRTPGPGDLKLDRMRALLRLVGDPHLRLRVVHIAGTKGKGSTAALLASVLGKAGYRTGLFTSPHLATVHERVQVDGTPISPAELTALLGRIRPAVAELDGHPATAGPTFFEIGTAIGFLHFVQRRVDVAVLEVGLGGRFDSTNVCSPVLCLITSISFDHTQQLGPTLASIAFEKAGIIKPGVPVVSGATADEARTVIETVARARRAPMTRPGPDFSFESAVGAGADGEVRRTRVRVTTRARTWPWLDVGLLGDHQAANAAVVVAAVEALRCLGLTIGDAAVAAGLAGVSWPARLEVVRRHPLVVLDCAHNVASVRALVEALARFFPPVPRLLVLGCSSDKDLPGMCAVLAPHFRQAFLTRYRDNPRAAAPEYLAGLLAKAGGPPSVTYPTPEDALAAAELAAGPDELICITGSVFLAGALRPAVVREGRPV